MNIGEKIKNLRKSKGYTQKQLAECINKSEITIRKYEAGDTNVPIESLLSISKALEIEPAELVGAQVNTLDYINLFKQYLESKKHFITDIDFITEIEKSVDEYVRFKIFEKNNN